MSLRAVRSLLFTLAFLLVVLAVIGIGRIRVNAEGRRPATGQARHKEAPKPAEAARPKRRGIRLVFVRGSDIWALYNDGKQEILVRKGRSPAWSWDGKRIAFLRNNGLYVLTLGRPNRTDFMCMVSNDKERPSDDPIYTSTFSWHPSYPQIAFSTFHNYKVSSRTSGGGELWLGTISTVPSEWPVKDSEIHEWLSWRVRGWNTLGALGASHPAWSPDGKMLAYVRAASLCLATVNKEPYMDWGRQRHRDYHEESLEEIGFSSAGYGRTPQWGCGHISWRPDNKALAYEMQGWNGWYADTIKLYTLPQEGKESKPQEIVEDGYHPSFAPDGRHLAFASRGNFPGSSKRGVYLLDLRTHKAKLLALDGTFPECNPDRDVW
jgi:dipeptidyl aminopeptidase/acylaminoacyl peptidase